MAEKNTSSTAQVVVAVEKKMMTTIEDQLKAHDIKLDSYACTCAVNAISAINELITKSGLNWASPNLDSANLQDVVKKVALQKLNTAASNREVYFTLRNTKFGNEWKKVVEVGIEGDGNDAILRNFGVDVKKVYHYWAVREDDEFEYPSFKGVEVSPPSWKPGGTGKIARVVYPIQHFDDSIEYIISERADVKRNLLAHIGNNMMNETFGICADRFKATAEEKAKIDAAKKEIISQVKDLSLEEILASDVVDKWISPAWKEPQSSEAMILRKMRNNAVKKYPKDFGNAYAMQAYNETTDETTADMSGEISANSANSNADYVECNVSEAEEIE